MRKQLSPKELSRLDFAKKSIDSRPYDRISIHSTIDRLSVIGMEGFGFARDVDGTLIKVNHSGNVCIQRDVVIRAFVTIDRAVTGSTFIGQGTAIDHHVHIAHNVKIGEWNTLAAHCIIEGSCVVGSHNTFGAGVIVQRKVKIGNNCIFGSGSVVTKDVPANTIVAGNPARFIKYISELPY